MIITSTPAKWAMIALDTGDGSVLLPVSFSLKSDLGRVFSAPFFCARSKIVAVMMTRE
jgi:hypothetical protein